MKAFTSRYIFDGNALLENKAVLVQNGLIIDIVNKDTLRSNTLLSDYGDGVITAGFIDLQLNGCGGVSFNDAINLTALETMYQTCLNYGTTYFLPTLITCSFADIISALEVVKQWFSQYKNTRGVLGIHLEGPFISKAKPGIHPKDFILRPTMALLQQIVAYTPFFPIKMTIAIEEFDLTQINFLVENGVILSLGHSNASYNQAEQGIQNGITTVTHMFNAMSGLTGRNPGVIGAVLNNEVYVGLIADLLHVDGANIKLLHKIKAGKIFLVTDAVTPTCTDMKEFEFAGKHLYVKEGKCQDELGVLGGTCLTMNKAVENCVMQCKIDLAEALSMASQIPAKIMREEKTIGTIAPGYRADLIHINLIDFKCNLCT
jgi:N-acetylglucosamine-6-phosphate deacetylase